MNETRYETRLKFDIEAKPTFAYPTPQRLRLSKCKNLTQIRTSESTKLTFL